MSKRSKISWNDKQNKQLAKAVKNFNAKLTYIAKNKPELTEYMPSKIIVKELKSKISTVADLNRNTNSLKRFGKKGAEEIQVTSSGLTFTKWHIKEVKTMLRIDNARKTREMNLFGINPAKGNMGQVENQNLRHKKFDDNKTSKEWEKMVESVEKRLKSTFKDELMEQYKENYLKAVDRALGSHGEKLKEAVQRIDAKTLYENSINDPILSIDFIYDPQEAEIIILHTIERWGKFG